MRKPKVRNALAAAVAAVLLLCSVAGAGVITAVSKRGDITVSGTEYSIDDGVALEDMAGQPITFPELRPGVPVELEIDEEGRLVRVRAAVVR